MIQSVSYFCTLLLFYVLHIDPILFCVPLNSLNGNCLFHLCVNHSISKGNSRIWPFMKWTADWHWHTGRFGCRIMSAWLVCRSLQRGQILELPLEILWCEYIFLNLFQYGFICIFRCKITNRYYLHWREETWTKLLSLIESQTRLPNLMPNGAKKNNF